jgi:Fic-DOC domain mobile mystery protein B
MGLILQYELGQTPLGEEEKDGLLIKTITTQGELNEAEQLNIESAMEWTLRKRFKPAEILHAEFCLELHRRMYGQVWKWAGQIRKTNKNIGVDKYEIPVQLRSLLDDCKFWIENQTFSSDEIALRFKHKIVSIHCFPNGNGRHSRLMADILASHIFKDPVFSWGAENLVETGDARVRYLRSLKSADQGDFRELLLFARQ